MIDHAPVGRRDNLTLKKWKNTVEGRDTYFSLFIPGGNSYETEVSKSHLNQSINIPTYTENDYSTYLTGISS